MFHINRMDVVTFKTTLWLCIPSQYKSMLALRDSKQARTHNGYEAACTTAGHIYIHTHTKTHTCARITMRCFDRFSTFACVYVFATTRLSFTLVLRLSPFTHTWNYDHVLANHHTTAYITEVFLMHLACRGDRLFSAARTQAHARTHVRAIHWLWLCSYALRGSTATERCCFLCVSLARRYQLILLWLALANNNKHHMRVCVSQNVWLCEYYT